MTSAVSTTAEDRPLAILTALGSRGDVNPMLAIAVGLREAGFHPVLILAEPYQRLADNLGLASETVISREEFDQRTADPRMWRPFYGAKMIIAQWLPDFLPRVYRRIEALHRPGRTVLVAHPLDLASRVFRDVHPAVPLASIHLAPLAIRNPHQPAHLTSGVLNVRRPAALVRAAYWAVDTLLVARWLEPPLNRFRHSLGLDRVARPLDQWWYSPDRVIGLFPEWFAPGNMPREFRCCGFPLYDGPESASAETSERLLAEFDAPPVVFTAGSAHATAETFFGAAVETAQRLRVPAILLSGRREQVPHELPTDVRTAQYVSLGHLLPHCRGIVHHGGIGTTSQSLAAGIPQLICPMAFDQFDNAARVVGLGCGRSLPMRRVASNTLTSDLRALLENDVYRATAHARAALVPPGPQSVASAVEEIQSLLAAPKPPSGVRR